MVARFLLFRVLAVACLGAATAYAWTLVEILGSLGSWHSVVQGLRALPWDQALVVAWLVVAPVVLLVAAVSHRRTPWPWVAAETANLVVLTIAALHVRDVLGDRLLVLTGVTLTLGLASLIVALPRR